MQGEAELHGSVPFFERYPDAVLAPLRCGYKRREPEKTLLYQVVAENLDAFLTHTREANPDGGGLPRFIEQEFRKYLTCGILSHGFSRVVCTDCGHEVVVGFSCQGRGFCPSCNTRRMHDVAFHLVDRVLPAVPYRQWVLAFPQALRLRLSYEREAFIAARRMVLASIFAWQRRCARKLGVKEPLVGAVSFAQRFASNLSLYPHLHLVLPDGVFFEQSDHSLAFRELPKPTPEALEAIAARLARKVTRWFEQQPLTDEPNDDVAATYAAAAETRRRATAGDPPPRNPSKLVAQVEGFSLEAGRHVHAHDRDGLARLCRYGARPPISMERLKRTDDGALVLGFKRAMADGSSGVRLTPFELLRRLAALIPPPGFHLIGYHGVFASRSKHRSRVVPTRTAEAIANDPVVLDAGLALDAPDPELLPSISLAPDPRDRYLPWAELMKRTRDLDVLRCEKCGGRMQLMSFVTDPDEAREILARLELQAATGPPVPAAS